MEFKKYKKYLETKLLPKTKKLDQKQRDSIRNVIRYSKTEEELSTEVQRLINKYKLKESYKELKNTYETFQQQETNDKKPIPPNPKDFQKEVLTLLVQKRNSEATEMMVNKIMEETHIHTTRDDDKCEMWIYHEGIYIPQARTYIKSYCRQIFDQAYTTYLANQVISKIEADTYIEQKDFFINDNIEEIAVKNGILNISTRSLRKFDPKNIFFNKIPVKYEPGIGCEAIISHFETVIKHNDDIPVIQELFGYLLYKEYNIEKAFMFIGGGRNGKGKTLEIMKRFIGPENCANISLEQIEHNDFAMAELHNKMANLAGDISKTALKNTGRFKGLTGRDMMSASRKFLSMIHFENYAKMIFCANDLPITYDTTPAFWNRWLIIEFPFTFISQKELDAIKKPNGYKLADPEIINKVTSEKEMTGLLNWALDGLERLQDQKDFSYSKNTTDVQDMWMRKSSSFNAFIKDELKYDYDAHIIKEKLRQKYAKYCKNNGLKPVSDKVIKNTLTAEFGAYEAKISIDDNRIYVWKGVIWK